MRLALLLSLFFVMSCASGPARNVASTQAISFGEVDAKRSTIKLFSNSGHPDLHQFYLEFRNTQKALVDVELHDIVVKDAKKILTSHIRRISLGRYEVEIDKENLNFKNLKFVVQKKTLKHQLVSLKKPVQKNSSIVIVSNEFYHLKARLTLKDKDDSLVVVQHEPDIVFTGMGEISIPKMVKNGVWEFEIAYPDENQIIYLSVRANGVLLEKLFRFQHVEK